MKWHKMVGSFKKYKSFRYHFKQGEPAKYSYAIDFKENEGDEDAYKTLFEDAGWETVFSYPVLNGNWMYFRKAVAPGETEEAIFTDETSLIQLYKNIRKTLDDFWCDSEFVFTY